MIARGIIERIRSAIADEGDVALADSILGSSDPVRIAEALRRYCDAHLGREIESILSLEFSIGVGAAVQFTDGSRAFVKIHHGETRESTLGAYADAQRFLHRSGFPCPVPLGPPAPVLAGIATVESFLDRGFHADLHDPGKRDAAALLLADLNRLLRGFPRPELLPDADARSAHRALWPKPHNALFDFSRDPEGVGWIDAKALEAKSITDADDSELIATHLDWGAKHFRFEGNGITAVYDWDSLRRATETESVGKAAAGFSVTWYLDLDRLWPSREESLAFVRAYEAARGAPFSTDELRLISAHAAYLMLYSARCAYASPASPEQFNTSEVRRIVDTIRDGVYFAE